VTGLYDAVHEHDILLLLLIIIIIIIILILIIIIIIIIIIITPAQTAPKTAVTPWSSSPAPSSQ
jgi:hypothetical protein